MVAPRRHWLALLAVVAWLSGCMALAGIGGPYQREAADAGGGGSPEQVTTAAGASGGGGGATSAGNGVTSSGAGGSVGAGDGGCGGSTCCDASDCPLPSMACVAVACNEGLCVLEDVSGGAWSPFQIHGDCAMIACPAGGSFVRVDDSTDIFDDGNECTNDSCDPMPRNTPAPDASCWVNGGTWCNSVGECVQCTRPEHCPGGFCSTQGRCLPSSCVDGILSPGEIAMDCGGPCIGTCLPDAPCATPLDCLHGVCDNGTCSTPACDDGVKNGDETATDCGGSCASKCDQLEGCSADADCKSRQCSGAVCIPNCQDEFMNGAETDVDCGGPFCPGCQLDQGCHIDADCQIGCCLNGACAACSAGRPSRFHGIN